MKYNIVFAPGNVDLYSTNIQDTVTLVDYLNNPNVQVLSYTLNNLPLTEKFIKYYKLYREEHVKNNKTHTHLYSYNYYTGQNLTSVLAAKKELNYVIRELVNVYQYTIDDKLKLTENSGLTETDKYNALHYIFETERTKLKDETAPLDDRRVILFEKINQIIHAIENGSKITDCYFLVIRPNLLVDRYKLQDEDYEHFTHPKSGDLICDYATVGKDLWACYRSNDIGLIKSNNVNQQIHLSDSVMIEFTKPNLHESSQRYHDWLYKNNIDMYLDVNLPKYKPGRHILGTIDQPIRTSNDFHDKIYSKTPKMIGTYLSDDLGNPILSEYL